MQLTQTIQIRPSPGNRFQKSIGAQPTLPGMEPEEQEIPRITNRQIAEDPESSTFHDLAAQPARNHPDENPAN